SGVLRVPAILFKFKNTPVSAIRPTSQFDDVLFAPSPTGASVGRPYTYASFYAQLSHGLLSVQGHTYGYAALDSNEVTYTGVPGTCTGDPFTGSADCNGLWSSNAIAGMQSALTEALRKLDAQVGRTQYESNCEGVGEYSLMGSGNYTSSFSPSRMDVWSLNELGWVIVAPLTSSGTYTFGPATPLVDTTFYIPVTGSNPRGEYFLLENRQRVLSD